MRKTQLLKRIFSEKLFFIFRDVDNRKILEIASKLLENQCNIVEVTYNSHYPPVEQINLLREHFGDKLIIGCGTILSLAELKHILDNSDVDFIVTPHFDADIIEFAHKVDLVTITGALTPTEIMSAHRSGTDIIKLFPASLDYIKQIRGPFRDIKIASVGGINADNAKEYIRHGADILGIGSYITAQNLSMDEIVQRITRLRERIRG